MPIVPQVFREASAAGLETAINAYLAPLFGGASVRMLGTSLSAKDNYPSFGRNLVLDLTTTVTDAIPQSAPFVFRTFSGSNEAAAISLITEYITANPGIFYSPIYTVYRPYDSNPNLGITIGVFTCTDPGAALNWAVSGGSGGTGIPTQEPLDRALVAGDNAHTLICVGTRIFTVNTGLPLGFGVAIKGNCSFVGTATVTDARTSGAVFPWCALVNTGTDTYDAVGSKV